MKLILALLLSACIASAQTLVQQGGNNASTTGTALAQSAAFTTVTAGDLLVVFGSSGNTSTHSAPTDTAGDTFTQCTGSPQVSNTTVRGSCWFKCNTAGGSTFTVTFNSTSDAERSMVVLDYSGISTGTCQDTGAGATSNATGTPSVTIVPSASGRLIVAGIAPGSGIGVYTAGTNYTKQREEPSNGDFATHEPVFVEDRLSAPSGSQTATGGSSVTTGWAMVSEAFIPAATGSGSMLGGPGMWAGPSQVQ